MVRNGYRAHTHTAGALSALVFSGALGLACAASPDAQATTAPCTNVELLVAASDYSSSLVCGAPRCERGPRTAGADLGQDPALSISGGRAFYIARDNALLFELDPTCGTPIKRFSVYAGAGRGTQNPHDVAVAPDGSLFVVLWSAPKIAIIEGGSLSQHELDLSGYDPDGNPQAEAIRIVDVGGRAKAFVSLQRLDDRGTPMFRSTRPSAMLRIDVATRSVEATIELAGRNPFNVMAEHDGALFLAEPGNFDTASEPLAGIERFDTATSTTQLLVREADLGGSVSEVAVTDGCGVAIVAGPEPALNPTSLVTFDPKSGAVLKSTASAVLGPTRGYDLQGLAWRGDSLYVGDRRQTSSGFRVHAFVRDPGTCNLHPLPEQDIALPERPVALRAAVPR